MNFELVFRLSSCSTIRISSLGSVASVPCSVPDIIFSCHSAFPCRWPPPLMRAFKFFSLVSLPTCLQHLLWNARRFRPLGLALLPSIFSPSTPSSFFPSSLSQQGDELYNKSVFSCKELVLRFAVSLT